MIFKIIFPIFKVIKKSVRQVWNNFVQTIRSSNCSQVRLEQTTNSTTTCRLPPQGDNSTWRLPPWGQFYDTMQYSSLGAIFTSSCRFPLWGTILQHGVFLPRDHLRQHGIFLPGGRFYENMPPSSLFQCQLYTAKMFTFNRTYCNSM